MRRSDEEPGVKMAAGVCELGSPGRIVACGGRNLLGNAVNILGANVVSGDQLGQDAQAHELETDEQERNRIE